MATYGLAAPLVGSHATVGAPATGSKGLTKTTSGGVRPGDQLAPSLAAANKPKIPAKPANPTIGGHYVLLGNKWQLIHAVGPNKWAKGPVPMAGPGVALNNPILGNAPVTGQARYNEAAGIADAQTVGPMAELAQQIAANNKQTAGTIKLAGDYYNQLAGSAQQGVTDQQGFGQALKDQLAGISSATQSQLQGIGQSAQDTLAKYAPQGEGGLSGTAQSSLAAEIARQQGLAAQTGANAAASGATQSANYGGLASSALGSNALTGTAALRDISQSGTVANQPLLSKVADLKASRGSLLATALGNLNQQGQTNDIARQTLLGKQAALDATNTRAANTITAANARNQATIDAANKRAGATNMLANKRFGLDQKKYGTAVAKDLYQRQHGLGPYQPAAGSNNALKPLATASQNALVGRIQTLSGNMQATLDWYTQRGYPLAQAQQLAYHAIKKGVAVGPGGQSHAVAHESNPLLLNAAYNNLPSRAGLTAGDIQALAKKMGLTRLGSLRVANSRTSSLQGIQGALAPAANAFR